MSNPLTELWAPDDGSPSQAPPLTDAIVASCEKALGVKLPRFLLDLYRAQNGGMLRDVEEFFLHTLAAKPLPYGSIRLLADYAEHGEMLAAEDADWVREEVGDPKNLVVFQDDGHCCHALNYNHCGPDGEPTVHYLDFECNNEHQAGATFEAFVKGMLPSDNAPIVDWEARKQLAVIAEETIVAVYADAGVTQTVHQLLGREGRNLVLFTHTRGGPVVEQFARTTISGKLEGRMAMIQPFRPAPIRSFKLNLQPAQFQDIKTDTSTLGSNGKWKNSKASGVPINMQFESKDRAKLETLRLQLFDGELPRELLAGEEWQVKTEAMTDDQRNAMMPHLFLQSMQTLASQQSDLGPPPEELLPLFENMERMKAEMLKHLQQRASDNPAIDPEMLKLIQKMHGMGEAEE